MSDLIKYGVIHCHTDNSMKDSALTVSQLVKKAVELGAPAITLTDHGTMIGVDDFMTQCKSAGIKGVPGVECYYQEDTQHGYTGKREHLILFAKNSDGLTAVSKIVTESNKRIDSKGYPRVNFEILKNYLGKGTIGYGNVYVTSACVGGILASELLRNDAIDNELKKLQKQLQKYKSPKDKSYLTNKRKLFEIEQKISKAILERDELEPLAKKSLKKKTRTAEMALKRGDKETYETLTSEIKVETDEIEKAKKNLVKKKDEIKSLSLKKRDLSARCKEDEVEHSKRKGIEEQIAVMESEKISEEQSYKNAVNKAKKFHELIGNNFYIELQNHFIDKEEHVMPILAKIAKELNIPVVAANDVHVYDNSPESLMARQLMRSLRYNEWEDPNVGDDQLYMKTDEEMITALKKILPTEVVNEAMENVGKILSSCDVTIGGSDHYPKFISDRKETADEALRRLAYEGIERRFPNKKDFDEKYQKRLEYELDIITSMGYSDYHLIVQDFLNFGRKLGRVSDKNLKYIWEHIENWDYHEYVDYVNTHMDEAGYSIGPGRGSAAGSLVCYLLGITSINPIRYNLLFERFLNKERVSMPDIDSDLSPRVRDLVIEYVKKKYGKDAVCCIMTRGKQKPRASIRNVARVMGDRDGKDYLELSDEMAKNVPSEVGMNFSKCKDDLKELYKDNKLATEILDNAMLIEDRLQSIGMHAAGVIISDGKPVSDYVALMWDDKFKRWKSQCDMVQSEARGLLKMDFLGLNNLSIITSALRLIKDRHAVDIDIENLPFEKEVFENIYANGFTNSVFQFESGGMKSMLRKFKPSSIDDIILLVAAYRPGPMDFIPSIIDVKNGVKKPDYVIPKMAEVLDVTYGYPVYQEQIMQIFNRFAGFTLGESDIIRRYMSKKKVDKFMAYKDQFINGLVKSGGDKKKAEAFWEQIVNFSKYAFNKSHAAAYAIVSYQTAYLKYHYPIEFSCAVMSETKIEKVPLVLADCKTLGIKVLPPNINESEKSFSVKGDAILFGMGAIKDVGDGVSPIMEEIKANGKFTSFRDYIRRAHKNKKVTEALIDAGAFDCFGSNRKALKELFPRLAESIKKYNEKQEVITKCLEDKNRLIELNNTDSKEFKAVERRLNNAIEARNNYENAFMTAKTSPISETLIERLKAEKEKIGVYVSGHPMDVYKIEGRFTNISDLEAGTKVVIVGVITDLRKIITKKSKKPMAFFNLEDKTGSIGVTCFPTAYESNGALMDEDTVVIVEGVCREETSFMDDEETVKKIILDNIREITPIKKELILHVEGLDEFAEVYEKIKAYIDPNGYQLLIHDTMLNEYRTTKLTINSEIMYKSGLKITKRTEVA